MKEKMDKLRELISARECDKAKSLLVTELAHNPERFVQALREKGVLRCSRYSFKSDVVAALAETSLNSAGADLSPTSQDYLKSVLALSELAPAVASELRKVQMVVNSGQFKTFLVSVEILFRRMHVKATEEESPTWRSCGLEELAAGFSYYFSLLREKEPIRILDINTLLTERLESDFYMNRLATLASISRFREAEIQIEAFPFVARTSGVETAIEPVSPEFEKSIRWGYITSEEQRKVDRLAADEMPSLKALAESFVEKAGDRLFEVIHGPAARIRIHFPLVEQFLEVFAGDKFFAEDAAFLRDCMKSLFVTYEQLRTTRIHRSISLIDVLKFRRVCAFTEASLEEYCKRRKLLGTPTYYRSLVAHFSEVQAVEWVSKLTGIPQPEDLLDLLCSTEEKDSVFDLQYTPIMKVAGQYLIPIGVVANSNVVRNALQRCQFRFDSGAKMDPLGDLLVSAFQRAGVPAKTKTKIRYAGREVEADVLAIVDNHLFALECKNSLHPCNSYELRQSYDYIKKAADQLDRFTNAFKDAAFRRAVSNAAGFDITRCTALTTCIVTGNRMFSGYRGVGHPVRNIYELENVVVGGQLSLMPFPKNPADPNGKEMRVFIPAWDGEKFSVSAVINYIEKDSWHVPAFEAMSPYDEVIRFGKRALRFKSFILDVDHYRNLMRQHPRAVVTEHPK